MKEDDFRPKGVLLDMDGLILDTERPLIPVWIEAGKHIGRDIKEETVLRAVGKTGEDVRLLCYTDLGADFPYDAFHKELNRLAELEMGKGIALKSGLIDFLDLLSSLKIPFVVATSTQRKWAVWKLGKAGIPDHFPLMVCGDDVDRKKPAPDIFLAAAGKIGLSPEDCAGFEDSVVGLQGLLAAGIRFVFVKDVIEPPEGILSAVWRRYNDLSEAAELFG